MKFILVIFFIFFGFTSFSQRNTLLPTKLSFPYIYLETGLGFVLNQRSLNLSTGFNISLPKNWGINYTYRHLKTEGKDKPKDYYPALFEWGIYEKSFVNSIHLTRELDLNFPYFRLKFEAGIANILTKKLSFLPNKNSGWFGSNYTISNYNINSNGLSLRTVFEIPYTQLTGLQFSVFGIFAKEKTFLGIETSATIGFVREKLKPNKSN